MKILALMILGLLVVGCGKSLTEEEKKVVGSYEGSLEPIVQIVKYAFLENRTFKYYENGVMGSKYKGKKYKWKLVGKEIHVPSKQTTYEGKPVTPYVATSVYVINPNGDLVWIATIKDEKRREVVEPPTFKKIK